MPLKMLLDSEWFMPYAWFRFIPNPDMLHRQRVTEADGQRLCRQTDRQTSSETVTC